MGAIARVGDTTSGHDCHPAQTLVAGSSNVFINGIPACRQGDPVSSHTCGTNTHDGVVAGGSGSIKINGKPAAIIGSAVSCGGVVAKGSDNTFGSM
jgi:uncharacterized Zn-binding protein involved in type VI secretion